MRQPGLLILFTLGCSPFLWAQNLEEWEEQPFWPSFEQDSLPYCTRYTEAEQTYIWDRYHGEDHKQDSGSFGRLIYEQDVRSFIYPDLDTFYVQNIWSLDTVWGSSLEKHLSKGYYMGHHVVLTADSFVGIVYEFLDIDGSMRYFQTMDLNDKPIARVPIAFYTHTGSYTTDDGGRGPWFTIWNACIGEDWVIRSTNYNEQAERSFQILPDGRIKEIDD